MDRFRAMELFIGSVDEGSFSAAGRRFGLSPASVSRHIGELEAALGAQLLNRTTRALVLTEAGEVYFERARRILDDLREADADAAALQSTPQGVLRVHSRMLFGITVVTPLLPKFQAAYPQLRIELRLSERSMQWREDEFDIDLRIAPSQDAGVVQRRLLSSERILVASPDYIARMPPLRQPSDILAQNCLTYWIGPEEGVVWRFMSAAGLEEIPLQAALTVNNGEVLRQLARAGNGIALLDDYTVAEELRSGHLQRLLPSYKVTNTTFESGIYAAYRQTPYLPEKIRVFLDFLVANIPRTLRQKAAGKKR